MDEISQTHSNFGVTGVTGVTGDGESSNSGASSDSESVTQGKNDGVTGVTNLPKRRGETARWYYHDAGGNVIGAVVRIEPGKGGRDKDVIPFVLIDGKWAAKGFPKPRPLYGLDRLAAAPDAGVVVTEGEKAADAAAPLFPDRVAVTWPGGAKAWSMADFSPLIGRNVILWPDADQPGSEAMEGIATKLVEDDPGMKNKVRLLRIAGGLDRISSIDADGKPDIALRSDDNPLPKGWDAADAVSEGWTAEHIRMLLSDPANLMVPGGLRPALDDGVPEPTAKAKAKDKKPYGPRFEQRDDGLYYVTQDDNGEEDASVICRPCLHIVAQTRDHDSSEWGRLLEWKDADGNFHRWAMAMALLQGDGNDYRKELARGGLAIWPGRATRERLTIYLQTWPVPARARCVGRVGWHGSAFVLPDRTVGESDEFILFQSETTSECSLRQRGTAGDWREHVAALCVGNSRLMLGASLSFAAPLLEPAGAESGGVHFHGESSIGKTTAARIAASVFGVPDPQEENSYVQTWRSTDNGLEGVAAAHCDLPLVFDEIGQADARKFGETIYMLANGQEKIRAKRGGGVRRRASWRTLFLSTGERTGAEIIESGGGQAKAGQEIRIVAVQADAGAGLGTFENLHGIDGGAEFSGHIKRETGNFYGAVGISYLEKLASHRDEAKGVVGAVVGKFLEKFVPNGAAPQVIRVAQRFALIAAGGELATRWGFTGWPPGDAVKSAQRCFADWIAERGGIGNQEYSTMLAQVRHFLEAHGASRFERIGANDDQRIINRAGFVRDVDGEQEYLILPEVFRAEVCKGHSAAAVAKFLSGIGALKADPKGKRSRVERLPGIGATRVYVVTKSIWGGRDDE